MYAFTVLPRESFRSLPWKNGLGLTLEIAISPEGADFTKGAFDFRVSQARVDSETEFSKFPEHDRFLVVKSGEGLVLREKAAPHLCTSSCDFELRQNGAFSFRGDCDMTGTPIDGAVEDFNVIFARERIGARVWIEQLGATQFAWRPCSEEAYAFALRGAVLLETGDARFEVRGGDAIRVESSGEARLRALDGPARLAFIEFDRIG